MVLPVLTHAAIGGCLGVPDRWQVCEVSFCLGRVLVEGDLAVAPTVASCREELLPCCVGLRIQVSLPLASLVESVALLDGPVPDGLLGQQASRRSTSERDDAAVGFELRVLLVV